MQTLVDLVGLGLTDARQHLIDSTSVCGHVSAAGGKGAVRNAPRRRSSPTLLAEKGHDGHALCESLPMHGILPIIPPRSTRKAPEHPDCRCYRDRTGIERMSGSLKHERPIATGDDRTARSFARTPKLAAASLCLESLVRGA